MAATFQSACAAWGLLEGIAEWDEWLKEASTIQTGRQPRNLFASILLCNDQTVEKSIRGSPISTSNLTGKQQ
jgi:hypothetical protein